jgi:hypothetical protein
VGCGEAAPHRGDLTYDFVILSIDYEKKPVESIGIWLGLLVAGLTPPETDLSSSAVRDRIGALKIFRLCSLLF